MNLGLKRKRARCYFLTPLMLASAIAAMLSGSYCGAQGQSPSGTLAGEKLSFDVASVRLNKSDDKPRSNVPMGPGNVFTPLKGGLFMVRNYTLLSYIAFAYKMTDGQLDAFRSMAPSWVADNRFDIEARTERTNVTKDDLRLMMRSLIAERFNMSVHYETRKAPAYALMLVKTGVTGPNLRLHPAGSSCASTLPKKDTPETAAGGFPTTCGGIVMLPASDPHDYKIGGSGISISLLANSLAGWGSLGRPVIDKTGLEGAYDFTLEFAPEPSPTSTETSEFNSALDGPPFQYALKRQLGLKLESEKGDVSLVVLDHIDRLIEN